MFLYNETCREKYVTFKVIRSSYQIQLELLLLSIFIPVSKLLDGNYNKRNPIAPGHDSQYKYSTCLCKKKYHFVPSLPNTFL